MDNLLFYYKESELDNLKLNHEIDCVCNLFMIESKTLGLEKDIYNIITEDEYQSIYESKESGLLKSMGTFIDSIIKSISDFISKCIDSIKSTFIKKENTDDFDKLKKALDNAKTPEQKEIFKRVIELKSNPEEEKLLNEYIKELVKLEREVLNIKAHGVVVPNSHRFALINDYMRQINQIDKKIDKLNEKYNDEFFDKNEKIIKMSLEDAIRFNDKALDNVKLNLDNIEKNGKKILSEFKKDLNGNDVPVECKSIIKKMINSLGTKIRKVVYNHTTYTKSNFNKALKAGLTMAAVAIATPIAGKVAINTIKDVNNKLKSAIDDQQRQINNFKEQIANNESKNNQEGK